MIACAPRGAGAVPGGTLRARRRRRSASAVSLARTRSIQPCASAFNACEKALLFYFYVIIFADDNYCWYCVMMNFIKVMLWIGH